MESICAPSSIQFFPLPLTAIDISLRNHFSSPWVWKNEHGQPEDESGSWMGIWMREFPGSRLKSKSKQNKLKTKSIYDMLGIKKYHDEKENEDKGVRVIEHSH